MKQLQDLVLDLWKPNSVRSRYETFKPVFERFVGVENEQEYNDLCKTIAESKDNSTLVVDGNFVFQPRLDVLAQVKKELPTLNLDHLTKEFLIMFANPELNEIYLRALNYTIALAKRNGLFKTRKQQENFICNQIVYTTQYLLNLPFEPDKACKVIVYDQGQLDEKGFWFLMLCYAMGMDVVVLAPQQESPYFQYDLDHLSQSVSYPKSLYKRTFAQRTAAGQSLNKVKTIVSTLSQQTDASLFGQTGVFKPWMFRGAPVEHLQLEGTRIDLEDTWNREARLREGFQVERNTLRVPSFYIEIDGVDRNRDEYLRLVDLLKDNDHVLVDAHKGNTLLRPLKEKSEAVKLVFSMNPNGTFDPAKLKAQEGYVFDQLSSETSDMFIRKLNTFLSKEGNRLSKEERVEIANVLLSLSKPIARMIENFDYPFQVPKVLILLNKEERINRSAALALEFLSDLGFDIAILSPSGVSGLSDKKRSILRLDKMVYDFDFSKAQETSPKEKSFMQSVFDFFK